MAVNKPNLSKLHEVATRVVRDEQYADHVRQKGLDALKAGPGTREFAEYFDLFSATPGELAHLGPGPNALACTCNSTTVTTLSTIATPIPTCCGATVTTTTSGS